MDEERWILNRQIKKNSCSERGLSIVVGFDVFSFYL